jgi:SP family sugar:H+ symporter-like MFS transporter
MEDSLLVFYRRSVSRSTGLIATYRADCVFLPSILFRVVPSVVASLIWFQPESPRWLLSQGRTEEARVSLRRLRRGNDEEVEIELQTIIQALEKERAAQRGANATYWDIFKGTNAKRTMISVLTGFFQQATGQVFSSLYGPVIVSQLGAMPTFTFTLVNTALGFVAQLFVSCLDRFSLRQQLTKAGAAQMMPIDLALQR